MTSLKNGDPILVVRADRIGDVILSTPVVRTLRQNFPQAEIDFYVQPFVMPLFESWAECKTFAYDPSTFSEQIQKKKYQAAFILQSQYEIAKAVWKARIPSRVGPWSKPYSFFTYNKGRLQRRSQSLKSEADYGLDLLQGYVENLVRETAVGLPASAYQKAKAWLEGQGLASKKWIAIHPGMGGSAPNWSTARYIEFINLLLKRMPDLSVVLTAGPSEQKLVEVVRDQVSSPERVHLYGGAKAGSIADLGAIFASASQVFAPSTGPLHLAAAVGCRVTGIYPSNPVQSARRWGPYPPGQSRFQVFSTQSLEPLTSLDEISPQSIVPSIEKWHEES